MICAIIGIQIQFNEWIRYVVDTGVKNWLPDMETKTKWIYLLKQH